MKIAKLDRRNGKAKPPRNGVQVSIAPNATGTTNATNAANGRSTRLLKRTNKPSQTFLATCDRATIGSDTVIGGGTGLLSRSSPGIRIVSLLTSSSLKASSLRATID